jgi:hypothetical protein
MNLLQASERQKKAKQKGKNFKDIYNKHSNLSIFPIIYIMLNIKY